MNLLLVDCCIREDESRTLALANAFLDEYARNNNVNITALSLPSLSISPLDKDMLQKRSLLCEKGDFTGDIFTLSHQFANADRIVVAAPYWDLSFPALLKTYIENVCVAGITFYYTETGPKGLCKADKLMYITTSGAFLQGMDFGSEYIRGLCRLFGIDNFSKLSAEGLDIDTLDSTKIMNEAIKKAVESAMVW